MPVPEPRSVDSERVERRARRRRAARRRRLVALVAAVAGASLVVLVVTRTEQPEAARTVPRQPETSTSGGTTTKPAERLRRPAVAPRRLGSGHPVTLAFGGDIHFESPIAERLASSPASVLAPIARVLRRADLAMVNLETAVTDRGAPEPKEFTFRAPESAFAAIRSGGVDVVTVANNHGMDYGVVGMRETLESARRARLPLVGAGANAAQAYAPMRRTVHGQRIAIIGATQVLDDHLIRSWTVGPRKPGLASAKQEARLLRAVRAARATSDTVVVYVHWGKELTSCPTRFSVRSPESSCRQEQTWSSAPTRTSSSARADCARRSSPTGWATSSSTRSGRSPRRPASSR
jgi:Bacterial capsule synthesis protein PGA_cap